MMRLWLLVAAALLGACESHKRHGEAAPATPAPGPAFTPIRTTTPAGWPEYVSPHQVFSVRAPGPIVEQKRSVATTTAGGVGMITAMYIDAARKRVYYVLEGAFPTHDTRLNLAIELDAARDKFLGAIVGSHLVSEERFAYRGRADQPGLLLSFRVDGGGAGMTRFIMDQEQACAVSFMSSEATPPLEARQFVDSVVFRPGSAR